MNGRFTADRIDRPFRRWCNKIGTSLTDGLKMHTRDLQSVNYAMPMQNVRLLLNKAFRAGYAAGKRAAAQQPLPGTDKQP